MARLSQKIVALAALWVGLCGAASAAAAPAVEPPASSGAAAPEYSERDLEGARILQMDPAFVHAIRGGLDALYLRDYAAAKERFDAISVRFPHSAVGAVGRALVWQALMMENFDFAYDAQYAQAYKVGRERLNVAMTMPGNEAWESFLKAGLLGVEAIHRMRKGNYVSSLSQGLDAMRSVQRARRLAPEMPDLLLADGIYNYWRTVVTQSTPMLPTFGDRRAEGLEQIKRAADESIFLEMPAKLALAFAHMEGRAYGEGLETTLSIHRAYPRNVINNLVLSRFYLLQRMPRRAENVLKQVLVDAPKNQRAHYYLSIAYLRTGRTEKAMAAIDQYLAFELSKKLRASGLYRKGNVYATRRNYERAEWHYNEAWRLARHKRAKERLKWLEKLRAKSAR